MLIRRYRSNEDENAMMALLESEGEEWFCYWAPSQRDRYLATLRDCITYVLFEGADLCGYLRAIEDFGSYLYVCDLLVAAPKRGQKFGRMLMDRICADYPQHDVYVMSDADGYYEKQGFARAGSIFLASSGKSDAARQ